MKDLFSSPIALVAPHAARSKVLVLLADGLGARLPTVSTSE